MKNIKLKKLNKYKNPTKQEQIIEILSNIDEDDVKILASFYFLPKEVKKEFYRRAVSENPNSASMIKSIDKKFTRVKNAYNISSLLTFPFKAGSAIIGLTTVGVLLLPAIGLGLSSTIFEESDSTFAKVIAGIFTAIFGSVIFAVGVPCDIVQGIVGLPEVIKNKVFSSIIEKLIINDFISFKTIKDMVPKSSQFLSNIIDQTTNIFANSNSEDENENSI